MPRLLVLAAGCLVALVALLLFLDGGGAPSTGALQPAPGPPGDVPVESRGARVDGPPLAVTEDSAATGRAPVTAGVEASAGGEATYRGRVFDVLTNAPVEGATVRLVAGELEVTTRSDSGGLFALGWHEGIEAALAVDHADYRELRAPRIDLTRPAELGMERSGSIQGLVVQAGSRRPRTASVLLWNYDRDRYRGEPDQEVRTDARGRFAFEDVPPGIYAVGCVTADLPVAYETGVQVTPGAVTRFTLEVDSGLDLFGRVELGGSRAPVAGAEVIVLPAIQGTSGPVAWLAVRRTQSGPDGGFRLTGLATGSVRLRVITPWGAITHASAVAGEAEVRVKVQPPANLVVRVVAGPPGTGAGAGSGAGSGAATEGVSGARVWLGTDREARQLSWPHPRGEEPNDDPNGYAEALREGVADATGRVDFGAVPSKTKLLIVAYPPAGEGELISAARYASLPPGTASTERVLPMRARASLAGTVVDADGRAIAGVLVTPRTRLLSAWSALPEVHTDTGGRFSIPELPAGPVHLTFEHEGYRRKRKSVTVASDGEPLEVTMDPFAPLEGYVLDERGFAVPGARVIATRSQGGGEVEKRGNRADEFGRFKLILPDGRWTLTARATGWLHPAGSEVVVFVPQGTFVTLTMERHAVQPRANVSGEIVIEGTVESVPGLRFDQIRGGSLRLVGNRFKITGMVAGRSRVLVSAPGFEPFGFDVVVLAPGASVDLGRVEMRRTAEVRVNLRLPDGGPAPPSNVWLERLQSEKGGAPRGPKRVRLVYSRGKRHVAKGVHRYKWRLRARSGKLEVTRVVTIDKLVEGLRIVLQKPKGRR
ncbi:MAG: carboxypeptidase regulatory-like domain-containing protein [bacterium]|nr:carboxypeptidase regulatory-like domain-containing protein [bacterium]